MQTFMHVALTLAKRHHGTTANLGWRVALCPWTRLSEKSVRSLAALCKEPQKFSFEWFQFVFFLCCFVMFVILVVLLVAPAASPSVWLPWPVEGLRLSL